MKRAQPCPRAQTLLDFYAQRSVGASSSIDEVPGEVQGSILEKIQRNGVHSTAIDVSIEDALMTSIVTLSV